MPDDERLNLAIGSTNLKIHKIAHRTHFVIERNGCVVTGYIRPDGTYTWEHSPGIWTFQNINEWVDVWRRLEEERRAFLFAPQTHIRAKQYD